MEQRINLPMDATEIIKAVLTLIGGALGVRVFEQWIKKKEKNKDNKEKEVLLESLKSINNMYQYMNDVIDNTTADRFLILMGHDSGNIPNPLHPYYAKALWQTVSENDHNSHENLLRKYESIKVDGSYVSMIIDMITHGCVKIKVDELPDCFLKRSYLAEGVKYSEVYFLKQEKSHKIYYCSVSTTKDNEYFEDVYQRHQIELSINHIKNIFDNI